MNIGLLNMQIRNTECWLLPVVDAAVLVTSVVSVVVASGVVVVAVVVSFVVGAGVVVWTAVVDDVVSETLNGLRE